LDTEREVAQGAPAPACAWGLLDCDDGGGTYVAMISKWNGCVKADAIGRGT
jgi:hypothetical protein